jgi:hypothetical protein
LSDRPLTVMPDEYSAGTASAGISDALPLKRGPWSRSARWILLLLVAFWLVDAGVSSLLIHNAGLQKKLTAHLAAAFGRPVEVGRYTFSIWTGPALEAQSVTVSEDPRFGQEYFLRAESLRVRLRWQSLLRGHLALGTLLLTQPSLNVVRNTEGDWNLTEWLPRPAGRALPGSPAGAPALSFERIEVDGGRVNFKRGDEKVPFALVGVEGTVLADGPGRWRMDISATPWRAAIITQQAGLIHIAGHLGGMSSRLLPAVLDSSWTEASISDALRLLRGDDYGVRGGLAVVLSARADTADGWNLRGRAEMRQLHRWDLPLRPDNPALNLIARMKIGAGGSGIELTDATLEAPRSSAHATGQLSWNNVVRPAKSPRPPSNVKISDVSIDSNDILAWVRAFRAGIADDISLHGTATADGLAVGWPLRFENASLVTDGADLKTRGLRGPVHLARVELHYDGDQISVAPVTLSFGPPHGPFANSFRLDRSSSSKSRSQSAAWRVAGNMEQLRNLLAAAGSLGWNLSRGWDLAGPFRCDLRWQEPLLRWARPSAGFFELGGTAQGDGASLSAAFLNRPVDQIKVRADWKPGLRHVALSSAQAFGARWSGTFDRRDLDDQWQFVLSADRLASSDFDLWLNPRWRESFIDRMLPFLSTRTAADTPDNMRATGRLNIDQLTVAPVTLHHLQGVAALSGRHFEFTDAAGQFYGGSASGMFIADLKAVPSYQVNADFAKVDLSALAAASASTADLFAGTASGQVFFTAHGASRAELVSSVQCRGSADVDGPEIRNISLLDSLRGVILRQGTSRFHDASAAFTCANGKVQFHDFALIDPAEEIDGAGSVDFNHVLDFRLNVIRDASSATDSDGTETALPPVGAVQLTGPIAFPQLSRISSSPRRAR